MDPFLPRPSSALMMTQSLTIWQITCFFTCLDFQYFSKVRSFSQLLRAAYAKNPLLCHLHCRFMGNGLTLFAQIWWKGDHKSIFFEHNDRSTKYVEYKISKSSLAQAAEVHVDHGLEVGPVAVRGRLPDLGHCTYCPQKKMVKNTLN